MYHNPRLDPDFPIESPTPGNTTGGSDAQTTPPPSSGGGG